MDCRCLAVLIDDKQEVFTGLNAKPLKKVLDTLCKNKSVVGFACPKISKSVLVNHGNIDWVFAFNSVWLVDAE